MRAIGGVLCLLLAGCGPAGDPGPVPTLIAPTVPFRMPAPSRVVPAPATPAGPSGLPAPSGAVTTSTGWEITVYYTAVEDLHGGDPTTVRGCLRLDCAHGHDDLGSYPSDFVAAVEAEGTGRTGSGRYLNWSYDVGFWLDSAPRDTAGRALRPFVSAAADPGVLARGTRFRIAGCGRVDDGSLPDATVCAALRTAKWQVTDEFTPGLGGRRHIDAYLGEETGGDFTESAWYVTLRDATLRVDQEA
ncbi:hypothetical protein [Actinoplanes sp. N902-109]|uniref:hypothetical protein n=1 Tax=Actinoplanes sp. (strain N902-109) TaxID=649831 RepID=UPI00032939A0|nr:hypothetical protein [Actinoplanes sp. N902-109]AGL18067.1 hypothetical protein L083_4557 [Actinoplanes sp. N902-109]